MKASAVALVRVNLVVTDLDRSRAFHERLGFAFRAISPPGHALAAWISTGVGR